LNLFAYPFLADENIHPDVIAQMKSQGLDVWSVSEEGLMGQVDTAVLQFAHESGRVVLTHDSDFGTLAIARQQPITGIVYLRPGHIQPEFTLATLEALRQQEIQVAPPFIIVALRQQNEVRVRVRQM